MRDPVRLGSERNRGERLPGGPPAAGSSPTHLGWDSGPFGTDTHPLHGCFKGPEPSCRTKKELALCGTRSM